MRLGTGLLICCCMGLAACTASAPKGPDVAVSTRGRGRTLDAGDMWIAAAAMRRGATLLTHDKDFVDLEIPGLDVVCRA